MKDVVQFKPKEMLDIKTFKILAFNGRLFLVERWSLMQAVTMACNYYEEEDTEKYINLFYRFLSEKSFSIVSVPNRIKKRDISKYVKEKFG